MTTSTRVFRLTALACALASPWLSTAIAQPTASATEESKPRNTALDPIIVTATRTAQSLSHTIGDDSVIGSEQLAKTPNDSLAKVLGRQHGISFVDHGGPQSLTTLNVRGTNSRQSLVMIDGMRVNSPTNGLPVLNAIPLNAIDRIEIVRGAASSLYGSNAIGGVINIITRQPSDQPLTGYLEAGVGSYGTSEYSAGVSGSQGMWSYSVYGGYAQSAGYQTTNGDYAFANSADSDSYYRHNWGGQLGLTWADGQTFTVQTLQSHLNGGYDTAAPLFNDRSIQTLDTTILTSRNQLHERWLSTLSASFLKERNETHADPSQGGQGYFESHQTQYQWINTFTLTDQQTLNVGVEHLEQSADGFDWGSPINFTQSKIHTNSVMANYTGEFGAHQLQASARLDSSSQFGRFTSGSLSYAYNFAGGWQVSAGASNAFRAPNFSELYYPGFGNPNLSPEKSNNYELGLRYRHEQGEVSLLAYHNRIKDLIASQAPTYIPENIQSATIKGLTLAVDQSIGRNSRLWGSFDWLSPYNDATGQRLPFIAQRTLKLGAEHRIHDVTLDVDWLLTSDRTDGNFVLGGYGLLNLGVQYAVTKQVTLQARWNNVLGKDYTLVRGYNTPGSNVFFNVRVAL